MADMHTQVDALTSGRLPSFIEAAQTEGKVFDEPVDVFDAIEQSGLNYVVAVTEDVQAPIQTPGGTVSVPMTGWKGVIRVNPDGSRGPLGVVKNVWRPCQNADGFDFAQSLVDDYGANIVAAATYGKPRGAQAYLALQLPNTMMAGGSDPHDIYVIVTNAHNGNASLTARVAPIRRSTGSEIATDLLGASMTYTVRHSGDIEAKFQAEVRTMGMVTKWIETYEAASYALLGERMDAAQFKEFAEQMLPTPRGASERQAESWAGRRRALTDLFENAPGQAFGRGTRYAAFTAFCEFIDFYSPARGGNPQGRRSTRVLEGRAGREKAKAWKVLNA